MATQAVGNGVDRNIVEISVQDKCGHTKHQDSHLRSPKSARTSEDWRKVAAPNWQDNVPFWNSLISVAYDLSSSCQIFDMARIKAAFWQVHWRASFWEKGFGRKGIFWRLILNFHSLRGPRTCRSFMKGIFFFKKRTSVCALTPDG